MVSSNIKKGESHMFINLEYKQCETISTDGY